MSGLGGYEDILKYAVWAIINLAQNSSAGAMLGGLGACDLCIRALSISMKDRVAVSHLLCAAVSALCETSDNRRRCNSECGDIISFLTAIEREHSSSDASLPMTAAMLRAVKTCRTRLGATVNLPADRFEWCVGDAWTGFALTPIAGGASAIDVPTSSSSVGVSGKTPTPLSMSMSRLSMKFGGSG